MTDAPRLLDAEVQPGRTRVWCRLRHRPLEDATSRALRLGPDCAHRLGQRTAPRPADHPVDQDPLPGV